MPRVVPMKRNNESTLIFRACIKIIHEFETWRKQGSEGAISVRHSDIS
jgi:hypothetical protein